jgi:hypothetical protein
MPNTFECIKASINEDEYNDGPEVHEDSPADTIEDVVSVVGVANFSNHGDDNIDQA